MKGREVSKMTEKKEELLRYHVIIELDKAGLKNLVNIPNISIVRITRTYGYIYYSDLAAPVYTDGHF